MFIIHLLRKDYLVFILLLMIGISSCNYDPFHVNLHEKDIQLSISRFEGELFSADPSKLEDYIPVWGKKYGIFLQHYSHILRLGDIHDPDFPERLRIFVTDRSNYLVYRQTMNIFPDLDAFTRKLSHAFTYYHYYFPDKPIPQIITFISGFNQSAITDDSLLAIGLDRYLGTNEKLYRQIGVYNYLIANMHPQKLTTDCMLFWGETEFPYNDSIDNLVSNMVYRGKLMYFLHAMVPDESDTLKWGFTEQKLRFCHKNEKPMWTYLVENKLLFNTDRFTIDKFILDGPFTKDFGRTSPARAAVWLGYNIVSAYMKSHRDLSLRDLMVENDYMKILNGSAYNP
jgi:hypothetical protein